MVIKLETKRLILRKPKISDWKDIVEGCKDLDVTKQMEGMPRPYTKKDATNFINESLKKWKKKNKEAYVFFIKLKSENKVIGIISLNEIDKFVGISVTSSWINKKYWKKGYITESKIAINDFAFNKLKLRKIVSYVYTDNKASNRTQIKMGYKLEGCSKEGSRVKSTGKIKDVNIYGLFKKDWKKNLPRLKKKLNDKVNKLK